MRGESGLNALSACPVQGVIDVISKKWALLIVAVVGSYGKMRYNEILRQLKGISPKSLADTLKSLEEHNIIRREAFNEIPPRVEYSLTQDGAKLRKAIIPLLQWAVDRSQEKDCVILRAARAHHGMSAQQRYLSERPPRRGACTSSSGRASRHRRP